MRLVILENSNTVAEWAARYVMKRINEYQAGPDKYFVMGLPTGMWIILYFYQVCQFLFVMAII